MVIRCLIMCARSHVQRRAVFVQVCGGVLLELVGFVILSSKNR
jgi:3-dehydroquinate synthetase